MMQAWAIMSLFDLWWFTWQKKRLSLLSAEDWLPIKAIRPSLPWYITNFSWTVGYMPFQRLFTRKWLKCEHGLPVCLSEVLPITHLGRISNPRAPDILNQSSINVLTRLNVVTLYFNEDTCFCRHTCFLITVNLPLGAFECLNEDNVRSGWVRTCVKSGGLLDLSATEDI